MFRTLFANAGMAVGEKGILFVCAPDERAVVALSAQGDERGRLPLPESPSNCAFACQGRRMLEIMARGSVYSRQRLLDAHASGWCALSESRRPDAGRWNVERHWEHGP